MNASTRTRLVRSAAVVAAAGVAIPTVGVIRARGAAHGDHLFGAQAPAVPQTAAVRELSNLSEAFATVAEAVKPSVVYVTAKVEEPAVATTRGAPDLDALPPEFRDFFRGMPMQPNGPQRAPRPRRGTATGSGFVISKDGYVLTNAHVVDGASEVRVRLLDRREFPAKVVGADPTTDVAVLRVDPAAAKGRSLGLSGTSQRSIQDFIQTDAAINPGNSGGPLINTKGEVIGINSAIASPTGSYTGYGFAVPINLARSVAQQLITTGKVERVALGVTVRDASLDDAAYVGLAAPSGVVVQDFADPSPAKAAGVQPGDVIVAVDGQPVGYVAQLQERVAFKRPGDVVALEVARKGGARSTLRVKLSAAGEEKVASRKGARGGADEARSKGRLGESVAPAAAEAARELKLPADARGVIVGAVSPDGPAAGHLAGADEGGPDVILSVEGTAVHSPAELKAALDKQPAGAVVTLGVYNPEARSKRIERVRLGAAK